MMKSSEMPEAVPKAMPNASAILAAVRFISSLRTPRLALRSTSVRRLTSPAATWTTATFAWSPSMMMKLGPVQDRGLLEQDRAAGIRLLHEAEQRAFRRPDDQEEFVGPIPHAAQPDDQKPSSDGHGEADGDCGSANQHC